MGFFANGTTISAGGTAIGGLTGISLPAGSRDDIDVSDHDSTDAIREFVAGMIDEGGIQLEGNNLPGDAGQAALWANRKAASGTVLAMVITLANTAGTTISFNAYVNGWGGDAPFDGKGSWSTSMKITGEVTVVAAPE